MPDFIGNIEVPEISPSGTFPILPEYPLEMTRDYTVAVHAFGSANAKIEQRYLLGTGARRWTIRRSALRESDRIALRDFWEARKGPYQPFTFNAPNDDGSGVTAYTVRFSEEPLTWQMLGAAVCSIGVVLVEIPTSTPTYTLNATQLRFPSGDLPAALRAQPQELIPLVKIQPKKVGYPAIFVSDRRCTIGSQLYQARLVNRPSIGQSMNGESDQAQFVFGNADRVMRDLANDVDLVRAAIEFSLFHVGTGIKLDLWRGEIVEWGPIDAGPEFSVTAADGFYELTLPYPPRDVSRSCWKEFADGVNCTWTEGAQGRDLVHFPGASTTHCDKGLDTPNGCLAHQNQRQYGAVAVKPQGVNIRDNSTGVWGFRRSSITSTSIVDESIYDQVIPEIYTDKRMPVRCKIAAGRDESDFYAALGIIGEGPLTQIDQDPLRHTLDGQSNHGPGSMGLRFAPGNDPAGADEFFSLGQVGNQVNGDWRKVFDGGSTYENTFAAGTAFLELRRTDAKGLQLSRPTDHEMIASVTGGLNGWQWNDLSTRVLAPSLTNPFWIAINAVLRARALRNASASVQANYFDVGAAISCAAIASDVVDRLIGTGTETQFKFRGVIGEKKPLRDWIQEILANALGYYVFSFGKLKLGIRANASAVSAFTVGNIILDSLEIRPLRASFNHLTVHFADEEFDFAGNSVTVQDADHANLISGAAGPLYLKSEMNLSGCSSKSQALRIAAIRLREELGGVTEAERKAARQVSFRSTILALDVEPGMVCSINHEDVPGGSQKYRITSWQLNDDYSVTITGRAVTDSMYDLLVGPKPADVSADPVPSERIISRLPPQPWFPNLEAPISSNPLLSATDRQMRLTQRYSLLAAGDWAAFVDVTGQLPLNHLLPGFPVIGTVSTSATGGSLPGGQLIFVALSGVNGDGYETSLSEVFGVYTPVGTNTCRVVLDGIEWPAGTSGYRVYASYDQNRISRFAESASQSSTVIVGTPPNVRTVGPPSKDIAAIRLRAKIGWHVGIVGDEVTGVTSSTISRAGSTWVTNELAGRVLSIISDRSDGSAPPLDFNIVANTADTFTVTPDPLAAGVEPGDAFVIRAKATTFGPSTIGDAKFVNYAAPSGLTVNEERGRKVRIIAGTGKGQCRLIASNSATVLTIEGVWETQPDATSQFIVEDANWIDGAPVEIDNAEEGFEQTLSIQVDNALNQTLLVFPVMIYRGGVESPEQYSPWREIYLYGKPPMMREVTADATVTVEDELIIANTTSNAINIYMISGASRVGRVLEIKRTGPNDVFIHAAPGESLDADGSTLVTLDSDGDSVIFKGVV